MKFDVTHGMRGWFAVCYDAETHEPIQTGIGSYKDARGAAVEAAEWAEGEGFPAEAERIRKHYNLPRR